MTKHNAIFRRRKGIPAIPKVKTMHRRGMENLFKRLLVVLLGLVIYRMGVFIPVPGVSLGGCAEYFKTLDESGDFLRNLNRFFGGAWSHASIFTLSVQPYITASILMRFFTLTFPKLKELQNESGAGREKINQYMRYLSIVIAVFQSLLCVFFLTGKVPVFGFDAQKFLTMNADGFQIYFVMVPAFVTGFAFLMWLCEQMTEFGVGNGTSFIIFAALVSNLPSILSENFQGMQKGSVSLLTLLIFGAALFLVLYLITFFELSYRKVPIQYAQGKEFQKRLVPMPESCLPLKFNIAEIMPAMVCTTLLAALTMAAKVVATRFGDWAIVRTVAPLLTSPSEEMGLKKILFLQGPLLIFSCFLYSSINFDCWETAEHLKKDKACIPGIRPGVQTAHYLTRLVNRITRLSALYILTVVCFFPFLGLKIWGKSFTLGGVSTLIIVGVVVEFLEHISTHIYSHQYENLLARTQFWKLKQQQG